MDDRSPQHDRSTFWGTIGDVPLSQERRSRLMPHLQTLLDDFALLQDLEDVDVEPSLIFRPWEETGDNHE